MATSASNPWPARLLMVATVMALFVLLGLAVSTQSRQDFAASPTDSEPELDSTERDDGDREDQPRLNDADNQGAASDERPDLIDRGGTDKLGFEGEGDSDLEPISLDIRSDHGSVGIRLDDGTVVATPHNGDGPSGEAEPLRPTSVGDGGGLRLRQDGKLEPVSVLDIQPGDLVIRPADDGLDIVRSDGSHTEIRRAEARSDGGARESDQSVGVTNGLDVVEVGADGMALLQDPDRNGQIDLGDGVSIQLPGFDQSPTIREEATTKPWRWLVLAIVTLALAGIAVAIYLRLNQPEQPFGRDFVGRQGVPAHRFDEFLAMLAADPDPARAIRLAFSAAETGMATLPARHATETPFEWYSRIQVGQPHLEIPLASLCSRFATARFAPERPTLAHRDQAIVELRQLAERAGFVPTQHGSVTNEGVRIER